MTDTEHAPFVRMLFTRKPIAVEAMRWHDTDDDREAFAAWFDEHERSFETRGPIVMLDSGSWMSKVGPGDWIVWDDEQDEFLAYTDAAFRRTHEVDLDALADMAPALAQADEAVAE